MDSNLRKLQLVQVEILEIIDSISKKNNINYSLYAGSLLGAVRHGGFIPWDDDLDVCMLRKDYNKFVDVWSKETHNGYILQNKENTPTFTQSFTKIRKESTTYIQYEWEKGLYDTGIFVDVFPIDRLPDSKIKRMLFFWNCMRYQLYTREFAPPKSNFLIRFGSRLLLLFSDKNSRSRKRKVLLSKITKYNENNSLELLSIESMSRMRVTLPCDLLDFFVTIQFENSKYMCVKEWDVYLKQTYGNYMELPPVVERTWTHSPILLDFSNSYMV